MTWQDYQEACRQTAVYQPNRAWEYLTLGLCGEAGEVAQWAKRIIRDQAVADWPKADESLILELGDVLWYVAEICSAAGVSLETVARANLAKLADRQARGAIHGKGSNR